MSTIVLIGASGSGKSTIENELNNNGFRKIVSYTTREPRDGEKNGKDYWFVTKDTFKDMLAEGLFAEYEEYSQGRFYGTLKSDYVEGNNVAVLTPNGIRQLKRNLPNADIYSVLVKANLGTRMLRYINRVGLDKFNFDDKSELCSRTDRDFGMFLGIDKEVNLVIDNNYNRNIKDVVSDILNA